MSCGDALIVGAVAAAGGHRRFSAQRIVGSLACHGRTPGWWRPTLAYTARGDSITEVLVVAAASVDHFDRKGRFRSELASL
jgi:hypothetical protein